MNRTGRGAASRPGNIDDLLSWLSRLDVSEFRYELEKLRAIRLWAFGKAGIGYESGSRVRIREGFRVRERNRDGSFSGWWGYRECLVPGATGIAVQIDFSPLHMAWCTEFRPDHEWSVSSLHGNAVRYWHGPAEDTPAGYQQPSPFDQANYPEGRKHVFCLPAADLELVNDE